MSKQFWPIATLKPESQWDEFDRDYIDFMQLAYAKGHQPCEEGACTCISLVDQEMGRSASLVFRGRLNGWEPILGDHDHIVRLGTSYQLPLGDCACVCVRPPFRDAGYLVLEWMGGRPLEAILADFEFVGGFPAGIAFRESVDQFVSLVY